MKLALTAGIVGITSVVGGLALSTAPAAAQAETTPKSETVQVQSGDSLAKIAEPRGTTYKRLFDANTDIKDPNVIYPGDDIRIPAPGEQIPSRPLPSAASPAAPAAPAAAPAPAPQRAIRAAAQPAAAPVASGSVWDRLAQCESSGNWSINTGNGYYGGLQFNLATWRANGGTGMPHEASREQQIAVAQNLHSKRGFAPWPACSAKLGLR